MRIYRLTAAVPLLVPFVAGGAGNGSVPAGKKAIPEKPNIDYLAAHGMQFDMHYGCGANSAPSRAAVLTGRFSPYNNVYSAGFTGNESLMRLKQFPLNSLRPDRLPLNSLRPGPFFHPVTIPCIFSAPL